jgi:hypothetical protein
MEDKKSKTLEECFSNFNPSKLCRTVEAEKENLLNEIYSQEEESNFCLNRPVKLSFQIN